MHNRNFPIRLRVQEGNFPYLLRYTTPENIKESVTPERTTRSPVALSFYYGIFYLYIHFVVYSVVILQQPDFSCQPLRSCCSHMDGTTGI